MGKDKMDIIEKIHKEKVNKASGKGKQYKKEFDESERYIKEMQEMELKKELRYNTTISIVVGAFLVLCAALAINSISHIGHASKPTVAVEQKQTNTVSSNTKEKGGTKKVDDKVVSEDKKAEEKLKTTETKQSDIKKPKIKYNDNIAKSLSHENDRKKILSNALALNGGKYEGVNTKYIATILRTSGVKIPSNVVRTDTLVKELEKQGWKKDTNFNDLQKGDIVFTIDTVGIKGVPSCTYIFMKWENAKKENAFIVDGMLAKKGTTHHKRSITVQTETTDKFQFFMRK